MAFILALPAATCAFQYDLDNLVLIARPGSRDPDGEVGRAERITAGVAGTQEGAGCAEGRHVGVATHNGEGAADSIPSTYESALRMVGSRNIYSIKLVRAMNYESESEQRDPFPWL